MSDELHLQVKRGYISVGDYVYTSVRIWQGDKKVWHAPRDVEENIMKPTESKTDLDYLMEAVVLNCGSEEE